MDTGIRGVYGVILNHDNKDMFISTTFENEPCGICQTEGPLKMLHDAVLQICRRCYIFPDKRKEVEKMIELTGNEVHWLKPGSTRINN